MYDLVMIVIGAAIGYFVGNKLSKQNCKVTNAIVGGASAWVIPFILGKIGLAFAIGGVWITIAIHAVIGSAIGLFVFGLVKGKKA